MRIFNYNQFLYESIVQVAPDLLKILNLMKDNKVANKLLNLLEQDIKTNYNFIKISEEPGKLIFVPDNQATRKQQSGATAEELFAAASNPTTINRLVKSLFNSNNIQVTDTELEIFGNKFKSKLLLLQNKDLSIRIVHGTEIAYWYDGEKYAGKDRSEGTLNKSCMRYDECQGFFDIYDNESVVSMIVKVNSSNQLEARALLWKTDVGLYLDRVYYSKEEYLGLIHDWAQLKFGKIADYHTQPKMKVELPSHLMYTYFPYMDTFCYYYRHTSDRHSAATLTNYEPDIEGNDRARAFYLHSTEGRAERMNTVYSDWYDENIDRDQAIFSDRVGSWILRDDAVWSDYDSSYLPQERAVKSETLSDYLDKATAVNVNIDMEGQTDWYPKDDDKYSFFKEEFSREYYDKSLKDNFYEMNDLYYNLNLGRFVFPLDSEGKDKIGKIYNNEYIEHVTELDAKCFDLKVNLEEPRLFSNEKYFNQYQDMILEDVIKEIEKSKASERIKKQKKEELEEVHNFLLATDYWYYTAFNKRR